MIKTAWEVHVIDSQGMGNEDYLITSGNASSAARRALKLAQTEGKNRWIGVPIVSSINRLGYIHIYN